MAEYGYIYYPKQCYDGSKNCKVHMHLHGCGLPVDGTYAGLEYIYGRGYNQVAAANDLIIIYPQVVWSLANPIECFDYSGYTDPWGSGTKVWTNKGTQMKALMMMFDRVVEKRDPKYKRYENGNILTKNWLTYWWWDTWRFWAAFPQWCGSWASYFLFFILPAWLGAGDEGHLE